MAAITTIRNLGPAMADQFARAGIKDAETLRALGADAAYARLIEAGHRPHFMAYIALALGLQDRGFRDLDRDEKSLLRARFDAVRTAATRRDPQSDLDAALDEIGVRPRRDD